MPFPQRKYYRLQTLEKRWDVDREELIYAIEEGLLRACIWLNECMVERGHKEDNRLIVEEVSRCEGLVVLRPKDCRRIFAQGSASIGWFMSLRDEGTKLRLSDEGHHQALTISIDDMVIWHQDCHAFEIEHQLKKQEKDGKVKLIRPKRMHIAKPVGYEHGFVHRNHYQHVTYRGQHYQFGAIQASVIRDLHTAHRHGHEWVHGKELLHNAGSTGLRLRDVFKSQKGWRTLIESDGRGQYRLKL